MGFENIYALVKRVLLTNDQYSICVWCVTVYIHVCASAQYVMQLTCTHAYMYRYGFPFSACTVWKLQHVYLGGVLRGGVS